MTEKERVTQWLYPGDKRRLKMLAAEADKPVGDVVNDLLNFIEQRAEQRRQQLKAMGLGTMGQPILSLALMAESTIQNMLENAEALKEEKGGWSGKNE